MRIVFKQYLRKSILVKFGIAIMTLTMLLPATSSELPEITKDKIYDIIEEYLLSNPKIVVQALEKFESNQALIKRSKEKEKIYTHRELIFNFDGKYINPEDEIVIVSYIDFNCSYCRKSDIAIRKVLKSNMDVHYIVKDLPILGDSSLLAAKASVSILLNEDKETHYEFVKNLMQISSGITLEAITDIAEFLSVNTQLLLETLDNDPRVNEILETNYEISRILEIRGTPTFIINETIYRGYIGDDNLNEIIKSYRKQISEAKS